MANEIDLGELQDKLDAANKKLVGAAAHLKRTREALVRAEDNLAAHTNAVIDCKDKIAAAARVLTK